MEWSVKGLDSLGQDPDHPNYLNYVHLCPPAQTGIHTYIYIFVFLYRISISIYIYISLHIYIYVYV